MLLPMGGVLLSQLATGKEVTMGLAAPMGQEEVEEGVELMELPTATAEVHPFLLQSFPFLFPQPLRRQSTVLSTVPKPPEMAMGTATPVAMVLLLAEAMAHMVVRAMRKLTTPLR